MNEPIALSSNQLMELFRSRGMIVSEQDIILRSLIRGRTFMSKCQHKIKHIADLYYVINMLYSDYAEVLGSDASTYIKLAKAYMSDPDAPEGKAFKLWTARE